MAYVQISLLFKIEIHLQNHFFMSQSTALRHEITGMLMEFWYFYKCHILIFRSHILVLQSKKTETLTNVMDFILNLCISKVLAHQNMCSYKAIQSLNVLSIVQQTGHFNLMFIGFVIGCLSLSSIYLCILQIRIAKTNLPKSIWEGLNYEWWLKEGMLTGMTPRWYSGWR